METKSELQFLGQEKISRLLLKFSVPCVLGLLISALYSIVDQIFIGNSELGYLGNAATGISFPVICIANAFAWSIGDGAAAFLSICAGSGDSERAHKCAGNCIMTSTIISVVFMIICLIWTKPLMLLFGASDQTLGLAVEYFRIIASFFPVYLLTGVINGIIRADGSPSFGMISMSVGAVLNIALDPLFIFIFKWGIAGAAWATVIGQSASFLTDVIYLTKPKTFRLKLTSFLPDKTVLQRLVALGGATFISQLTIVILNIVCNVTLAKYGALSKYGPDIPLSVFSIQTKVFTIVCNIAIGIVLGGQPIFGYNYGAGNIRRVREAFRLVLRLTLITGFVAVALFELFPEGIIRIFGSGNDLYREFAAKTFRIYLSLTMITCLVKMSAIFFQSIDKPVQAMASSLVRDILCFTPLALTLPALLEKANPGSGILGILYAAPISDLVALIVFLCMAIPFFKKLKE